MTTATFVKKARKDYPKEGIKKGDSYYWWSFRFGGTHRSKTAPKRSQLTQSNFLSQLYDIEDELNDLSADDGLPDTIADLSQRLRALASECEDALSNMPEGLQQGDTGQLLQERADACNSAADELEGVDTEYPGPEGDEEIADIENDKELTKEERQSRIEAREEELEQEFWEEVLQQVQGVSIDAS